MEKKFFVHPTATVEKGACIGAGTKIWHYAHVREGADIGDNCILGHCVFADANVKIGSNVKLGNKVSVFQGVTIEDDVLIGPHTVFTNDLRPRSVGEWKMTKTHVKKGASVGSNSTIICGIVIGSYAMVGAGSVVTRDVPDFGLVYGNPARIHGYVCRCGEPLEGGGNGKTPVSVECKRCGKKYVLERGSCRILQ